ncbi:hypothetical protein LCGC14_1769510 [marine sediment metagenome]|uniref:Uncharacterized protein n=1 Tax=marine sediment metagenome TaxID=412755 RepID=A0A0F9GYR3_9ZZZZ
MVRCIRCGRNVRPGDVSPGGRCPLCLAIVKEEAMDKEILDYTARNLLEPELKDLQDNINDAVEGL